MNETDFWQLLDRSASGSGSGFSGSAERAAWLSHRLGRIGLEHVVDFEIHFDAARGKIDTHLMWAAADQIMGGLCSGDSFWYFQPWLIGQGHHWYEHAARNPDDLADVPAVRALAGRTTRQWSTAEWPQFEALAYVARRVYSERTGVEDGLEGVLQARGLYQRSDPAPPGNFYDQAEAARRLPRLTTLFPCSDDR